MCVCVCVCVCVLPLSLLGSSLLEACVTLRAVGTEMELRLLLLWSASAPPYSALSSALPFSFLASSLSSSPPSVPPAAPSEALSLTLGPSS